MSNYYNDIKKCVSFVFLKTESGYVANWTWFFLWVKKENNPSMFSVYFITAKHVLKNASGNYFPSVFLRINTLDWGSKIEELPLQNIKIFEHEDTDVDIAVISCLPNQEVFDFQFLPDDMIAHQEVIRSHQIAEWDDVFFTGLFTSHIGQVRNQPIIRFWKIALIPEEKIEWKEEGKPVKLMDLILLECPSFGGNSWSPVFFSLSPTRNPWSITLGWPNIFLGGVMTWCFNSGTNIQMTQSISNLVSLQNIGISAITPSQKLHEILFSPELIEQRKS